MAQQKKPLVNPFEGSFEKSAKKSVENAVVNFTKIPEKLLEATVGAVSGKEFASTPSKAASPENPPGKNFTSLEDPKIKEMIEANMSEEDSKNVKLADLRKQLQHLRKEEDEARKSIEEEEMKRKQEEEEEELRKAQEAEQNQRGELIEPETKQKRGMLGKVRKKKTMENKAAQGKQ